MSGRLPARFAHPLTTLIVTLVMTCAVSGVATFMALGFSRMALGAWPISWMISWAIAFPTMLVVLPIVRRFVARIVAVP